uniref:Uncharacterized protein n=1 Tax=Oryza nivara TaxID=4536 RepID=A0A0E0HNG0_ORYNI
MVEPKRQSDNKGKKKSGRQEIWRKRNNREFRNEKLPLQRIIDRVTDEILFWHAGGAKGIKSLMPNEQGGTTYNLNKATVKSDMLDIP